MRRPWSASSRLNRSRGRTTRSVGVIGCGPCGQKSSGFCPQTYTGLLGGSVRESEYEMRYKGKTTTMNGMASRHQPSRAWWRPALCLLLCVGAPLGPLTASASDIEGLGYEFDIWIKMDEAKKNRIFILNAYTDEPRLGYDESVIGISWDQRFHPHWSWRAGARYIYKEVDPPDTNEARAVLDLKWYQDLGREWLLTNRNRLDLRWFDNSDSMSFRYRNRTQLEKPFKVFSKTLTGFHRPVVHLQIDVAVEVAAPGR